MNEVDAVLAGFAEATRVPTDEVAAHRALRDRVAEVLAGAGRGAGVLRVVDAGSFRHGTAVRGGSRFDAFVVLDGGRPKSLARAVEGIRAVVADTLPECVVRSTPDSVLVDGAGAGRATGAGRAIGAGHGDAGFGELPSAGAAGAGGGGAPPAGGAGGDSDAGRDAAGAGDGGASGGARLRLVPAYEAADDAGSAVVAVPDAARRWVLNRPGAREQLIERIDDGHLRSLIRLVLAWKYVHHVPISSYYLETAVIRQALRQPSFNLLWDLCWVLEQASHDDLMNLPDLSSPSQVQKVRAADTLGRRIEAQVPLDRAAADARAAVNAYLDDDRAALDARLSALFGTEFTGLTP